MCHYATYSNILKVLRTYKELYQSFSDYDSNLYASSITASEDPPVKPKFNKREAHLQNQPKLKKPNCNCYKSVRHTCCFLVVPPSCAGEDEIMLCPLGALFRNGRGFTKEQANPNRFAPFLNLNCCIFSDVIIMDDNRLKTEKGLFDKTIWMKVC